MLHLVPLFALATGIDLATVYWQWRGACMGMAFVAVIALALVGGLMTGRPARRLRQPAQA